MFYELFLDEPRFYYYYYFFSPLYIFLAVYVHSISVFLPKFCMHILMQPTTLRTQTSVCPSLK